eukprot:scaffold74746_cov18-Prasinocladus_malaysianus.AAC.2
MLARESNHQSMRAAESQRWRIEIGAGRQQFHKNATRESCVNIGQRSRGRRHHHSGANKAHQLSRFNCATGKRRWWLWLLMSSFEWQHVIIFLKQSK